MANFDHYKKATDEQKREFRKRLMEKAKQQESISIEEQLEVVRKRIYKAIEQIKLIDERGYAVIQKVNVS